MEYQQASPATTFSKKLANGGGLTGKHAYDGVFGGAAKPGSRMEDYREIFGGSATCSIPVLDFPELKERNTFVEARSSKPDYSMIFGGFEGADFAVPYEELLSKPKRVKNSSKEAREEETLKIEAAHAFISKRRIFDNDSDVDLWVQMLNFQRVRVPAEARCASAGPEHPNFSEEKQAPPVEVSCQSFDDVKQFNISYNKSHIQSKNGINGPTHIAQLNAVPGYTVLIDEVASQQVTDVGKPVWTALNDDHLKVNVNEGIKASRPLRKVVSGPQPIDSTKNTSTNNSEIQKKSSRNKSFSNDISFDSFEIGLSTPSTMPPSNDGSDKGSSIRLINSKFGVFGSDDSKGVAGSYSPPYLDEEIDTNSAAAASAAAVRKAIEEAQAKIKIAKELMERKKQGFQNRVKPSFNDGLKAERREMKAAEKANRSKEEAQEMHLKDCSPKQVFNGLPEHNAIKASQAPQDFRNVKKSSAVKNDIGERHSKWTQVDSRLEATSGKTTKGFSEPAGTGAERETALEVNWEINVEKMKTSADEIECEEKMTGIENINKSMNTEKRFEAFDEVPKQEKVQWELRSVEAAFQWDIYRHSVKSAEELYRLEENEAKIRVAYEHNEASQIPEMINEQEEDKSTVKRLSEPEENAKFEIQELENKDIKKKKEVQDQFENEKRQWEADHQEEMVNQSNEVPAREENEKGLDEIHRFKVNERGQKEDLNRVECEKKQEEHFHEEENEKIQNGVPKPGDAGKLVQVHTQELIGIRLNGFQDKEESEKRQKEDYETKSKGNVEEAKENERVLKEDCQMNETEEHNSYEDVESERIQTEIHLVSEDKGKMEVTEGTFMYEEDNMEAMNHVYKLDENEKAGKPYEAKGDEENFEGEEVTGVVTVLDNERMIDDFFPKETGKGSKIVEETDDQLEVENIETVDAEHGLIGLDGNKEQRADVYSGETDLNLDKKQNKYHVTEYERVCEQKNHSEEATSQSDENEQDASNSEISFNDEESESNFVSSNEERWLGKGIESETCCDLEKQVEEAVCGLGEINQDGKEPEVAINHEEDETFFESSSQEKWVNNSIDVKASQLPHIFEGEENNMEVSQVEQEEKKLQISEEERTNQSTDKEENDQETRTVETRETEENLQKEVKLGKEHHERKEEVKIREMEKEKERIAVERAIREARERAFAEACERAAAERAAAEARERLEKVPAANGKSAAEKASMEAKLKAERAAVERATAEARERALEKALSEKASFQMRNQAEKPVSEKFSGASRDSGIKPSDQNKKGSGPSSSSRYPIFSNNDVPSSTDRFPGTNGESTERYKATFDRNQRTAERAAKALAEKNMRDLLAQKEQAERNRLAEMLDADVKRWSSGKERNLRALLSTLQYILGSDSGWQPIPLTDLISTAAVKKAYRKATLFVHPDKLQQRGASIQQKYTCEKVFDLLKDAWNKFNSEER